jgi:TonB family protein
MKTFGLMFVFMVLLAIHGNATGDCVVQYGFGTDTIYEQVDKKPFLKKHPKNTVAQLHKAVRYPVHAKLSGLEGVVLVSCVIKSNGTVDLCKVEQGVEPELDEEAVRVIFASGPWEPGKLNGVSVDTRMVIPIRFQLTDQDRRLSEALSPIDFRTNPPVFVLDGKFVDSGLMELETYNVKSIRVLKGEKALNRYGEQAKNGVIEITTKRGTPPLY